VLSARETCMRRPFLLLLGFAATSILMPIVRRRGPFTAVAIAGVLEEAARALRNQSAPPEKRFIWSRLGRWRHGGS
jgi:hypothetical protein